MAQRQGKDMTLKIVGCRHVYAGRNQRGDDYAIYEVEAAKLDGQLVREKLRAFTSLPIGQELEVTVVPFDSDQYGRSFTLYPKGSRSTGATQQMNELRGEVTAQREMIAHLVNRVAELEAWVGQLGNGSRSQATPPSANGAELDARFGGDAPW